VEFEQEQVAPVAVTSAYSIGLPPVPFTVPVMWAGATGVGIVSVIVGAVTEAPAATASGDVSDASAFPFATVTLYDPAATPASNTYWPLAFVVLNSCGTK
jgi:hypothetical protein